MEFYPQIPSMNRAMQHPAEAATVTTLVPGAYSTSVVPYTSAAPAYSTFDPNAILAYPAMPVMPYSSQALVPALTPNAFPPPPPPPLFRLPKQTPKRAPPALVPPKDGGLFSGMKGMNTTSKKIDHFI
eukprot:NODE_5640_length_653_cov_58.988411_g5256_i0.p1 GENE.NODE_5640_length_653_cov_58.988411_g5256_i0~~NODE_5640_length_653_cov_58.988411_g5256_i0.p1  ORF type:complete len:128 (+),score=18.39 NODE_5640_length_653_cov_58.988411_g5256_i0:89-472(+)